MMGWDRPCDTVLGGENYVSSMPNQAQIDQSNFRENKFRTAVNRADLWKRAFSEETTLIKMLLRTIITYCSETNICMYSLTVPLTKEKKERRIVCPKMSSCPLARTSPCQEPVCFTAPQNCHLTSKGWPVAEAWWGFAQKSYKS